MRRVEILRTGPGVHRAAFVDFDAIAAAAFGLVQRGVGVCHQLLQLEAGDVGAGQAEAENC